MNADRFEDIVAALFIALFRLAGVVVGIPLMALVFLPLDHYTQGRSWRESAALLVTVWRGAYWDFEPGAL